MHIIVLRCQFVVLILLLAGCGSGRPETITVYGRITLGGGEWPKPGQLYFTPIEPAEGFPRRPGKAIFGVDGRFEAFTWEPGDGLMPGTYKVFISCWETPPTMEGGGGSLVPEAYRTAATSPLEVRVEIGSGSVELEHDVPNP